MILLFGVRLRTILLKIENKKQLRHRQENSQYIDTLLFRPNICLSRLSSALKNDSTIIAYSIATIRLHFDAV